MLGCPGQYPVRRIHRGKTNDAQGQEAEKKCAVLLVDLMRKKREKRHRQRCASYRDFVEALGMKISPRINKE